MSSPVATPTAGRRGLLRWTVASVATAALVVSGSGLVVFAQSGAGESQGPQFVPADASGYVEARLDMPAGQAEAVAQMMTAFPGFADAGSFDMKKDELLAMLTSQMGVAAPEGDLIGDVFTGEVGIALGELESAMMGEDPIVLLGMAVADAEAAGAMMGALVAGGPGTVAASSYNDVAIFTDSTSSPPMSLAMHGDWMLMGTGEEVVQTSIDVLDGNAASLADDEAFAAAWSRLPDVRLGGAWMDLTTFSSFLDLAAMMAEGETGMALPTQDIAAMLPTEMVAWLVADSDRLTLETAVTPGPGTPAVPVGHSGLSLAFPADTQVYIETRELGAAIESGLTQLTEMMAAQAEAMPADGSMSAMGDIDVLLGEDSPITAMLGVPLPEFLDFVGDASVGAGLSSDGLWIGMAGEVADEALAKQRLTSLMTILRLATMQSEEQTVTIETSTVEGVEVTTITLPVDAMLSESGVPISVGDSIDVAIGDNALLIGLGDFVESAIINDGTDSLGASAGYIDALGEDTVNSGLMYMNIGSLLAELDPILSMMAPEWAEISPYATGLDRMIAVGTADDEVMSARMTVIVGQ